VLASSMTEAVSKGDFDRIFKKPSVGQVEAGPSFDRLIESVRIEALGPPDSIEAFSRVCHGLGSPVSTIIEGGSLEHEERYSTGVRIAVDRPDTEELEEEFEITEGIRKSGEAEVDTAWGIWKPPFLFSRNTETRSLKEIEVYNAEIRKKNEGIQQKNTKLLAQPRECIFLLSPINISLPIKIVDQWLQEVDIKRPIIAKVELVREVECETKVEAISVKIHGSPLSLREDGTLLWAERIILALPPRGRRDLVLSASASGVINLSRFRLQELVSTLFELNVLSAPTQRPKRKR
jgi:hypothetical protein